jgi:hypothetical protein
MPGGRARGVDADRRAPVCWGASFCAAELRLCAGVALPVQTHRSASADDLLMMITPGRDSVALGRSACDRPTRAVP